MLAAVRAVDAPDVPAAVQAAAAAPVEPRGEVGDWLRDSQAFVARGDHEGAFQAAARALSMAPDQPGVLADVARLLALMGNVEQGRDLCRAYLLQRPDCSPVQRALAELQPSD